jgi:hypothetical protein
MEARGKSESAGVGTDANASMEGGAAGEVARGGIGHPPPPSASRFIKQKKASPINPAERAYRLYSYITINQM